jgi:hypothetical protein
MAKIAALVHAVLGFAALTDQKLLMFANAVLKALTGNAAFPNPTPSLTTFAADITSFSNAATAAVDGGKNAKAARDKSKKVLVTDLRQLAMYCESNCNDDPAEFNTSGFTAKAKRTTSGPVGVPLIKSLDYGMVPGQILASIKSTPGAKSINLRFGPMPPGTATALGAASATPAAGSGSASSTAPTAGATPAAVPSAWTVMQVGTVRKAIPLNNLVSGTVYAVQVQALGAETDLSAWSDSSTIMCP